MPNDKTIAQCQICKGDINVGEKHKCFNMPNPTPILLCDITDCGQPAKYMTSFSSHLYKLSKVNGLTAVELLEENVLEKQIFCQEHAQKAKII